MKPTQFFIPATVLISGALLLPVLVQAQPAPGAVAQVKPVAAANHNQEYNSVKAQVRAKNYQDAITEAEAVLKAADLSANDKVRFLMAAADAASRANLPTTPFFERIIADAAIPNNAKVIAIQGVSDAYLDSLAGQFLDQMNTAPAEAELQKALNLPDLGVADKALALTNIARLFDREDKYEQARAVYGQILQLDVNDGIKAKAGLAQANSFADQGQIDQGEILYKKYGTPLDLIDFYNKYGTEEQAYEQIVKVVKGGTAADWAAFNKLPYATWRSNNYDALLKAANELLPVLIAKDPNRVLFLLPKFKLVPLGSSNPDVEVHANPAFAVAVAPMLLKAPRLTDAEYALIKVKYVDALAQLGQTQAALEAVKALTADAKISAADQFWAKLVAAAISTDGTEAVKLAKAETTLPAAGKASEVKQAATTLTRANNENAARALYNYYETLFAHPAVGTITCPFVDVAPSDVSGWLASPLLKDKASTAKIDKPYGDNLQFLLDTDSAVAGRVTSTATTKENTGDTDTEFHMACDAQGIHYFFYAHDKYAQQVLSGQKRGGGYEMYLAPGAHQAYVTWLGNLPAGKLDADQFLTAFPNAQFRLPSADDGSWRTSTRVLPDGFATTVFISWDVYFDKLPVDGTKWQFEAFRWTRSGGFSFGGSQSVHNRSSWGDITFSGLSPKSITAIKRNIIFTAVGRYKTAKGINYVGNWMDPQMGDPAFYDADVKPLMDSLDAYLPRVTDTMTDADVADVFANAVPGWMNLKYQVDALRRVYLQNQELAAG